MPRKLKPGDAVHWRTSHGETAGHVVKKVTSRARVKGHVAEASPEHPQFVVESDKSGARAIHKREALKPD